MAFGQEFGAVFPNQQPNTLELYRQMQQDKLNQYRYQQQLQMQKDARDFQMAKWLGDQYDTSGMLSGSPLDPVLNANAHKAMQDTMQDLQNGVPMAQLAFNTAQRANQLNTYASGAKTIMGNIAAGAKQLEKLPGVDPEKARNLAIQLAFHDGNGNLIDPAKLNTSQDYISQVLDKYPHGIVNGTGGMDAYIKGKEKRVLNPEDTVDVNGVKQKLGYAGEYYPAFNDLYDAKGKLVTGANQLPTSLKLKNQPVSMNGTSYDAVPDTVLNDALSDRASRIALTALPRSQNIDPDSELGRNMMKVAMFQHLKGQNVGYMNLNKRDIDNSQLERERFQQEMYQRRLQDREFLKGLSLTLGGLKESQIENNPLYGVMQGLKGNPDYLPEKPEQWTDKDGNSYNVQNITPYVAGAKIIGGKDIYKPGGDFSSEGIEIGKDDKGNAVVRYPVAKDSNGNLQYNVKVIGSPKELYSYFKDINAANGKWTPQELKQIHDSILGPLDNRENAYEEEKYIRKKNLINKLIPWKR